MFEGLNCRTVRAVSPGRVVLGSGATRARAFPAPVAGKDHTGKNPRNILHAARGRRANLPRKVPSAIFLKASACQDCDVARGHAPTRDPFPPSIPVVHSCRECLGSLCVYPSIRRLSGSSGPDGSASGTSVSPLYSPRCFTRQNVPGSPLNAAAKEFSKSTRALQSYEHSNLDFKSNHLHTTAIVDSGSYFGTPRFTKLYKPLQLLTYKKAYFKWNLLYLCGNVVLSLLNVMVERFLKSVHKCTRYGRLKFFKAPFWNHVV